MSKKRRRFRLRGPRAGSGSGSYPSPKQRERIIARRERLLRELLDTFISSPNDPRRIARLASRYDPEEIEMVLALLERRKVSFIGEEAQLYREYRQTFAMYGGDRPFLDEKELEALNYEYGRLVAEWEPGPGRRQAPGEREVELRDLLLIDEALWPDITPPDVPPRPFDYDALPPGDYAYPAQTLLEWGPTIDEQRIDHNARNVNKWWRALPDLTRMVLDEGLLEGWPGDSASWAPIHALLMLGALGADETAPQLFSLMDHENDWLSDRLPSVWANMGQPVEPVLWEYVEDRQQHPVHRGVVMLGLKAIAEKYPTRRPVIVQEFVQRLEDAPVGDKQANAYMVFVLIALEAVEAAGDILMVFEADKIDTTIVASYDVESLFH